MYFFVSKVFLTKNKSGEILRHNQEKTFSVFAGVQRDKAPKIIQSSYELDLVNRVTNKLAKAAAAEKAKVHYNWEVCH